MKKAVLLIVFGVFLTITSCELFTNENDREVFLKIGNDLEYRYSDIELYDSSAHILYFKTSHDEFKDLEWESFTFLDNGKTIYTGGFWPGYSSSGRTGPFISSPATMFGTHALRIEYWHSGKPDVRNCPGIIAVLNEHGLLHSGLSASIDSIEINGINLTFSFTVTNNDVEDLLILDINKTGPNLFHYFTNGLYIKDMAYNEVFTSNIIHEAPVPWDSWKTEWLSQLKSRDSRQYNIEYTLITPLNSGEYIALFEFPGLAYHVTKDQLYQDGKRIWLGDIQTTKKLIIK